jgi:hypothetical protein
MLKDTRTEAEHIGLKYIYCRRPGSTLAHMHTISTNLETIHAVLLSRSITTLLLHFYLHQTRASKTTLYQIHIVWNILTKSKYITAA